MSRTGNASNRQNGHIIQSEDEVTLPTAPPRPSYFSTKNEENVVFPLMGTNECPEVLMWGWTKNIPLEFPGLRVDLCVQTVDLSKGRERYPRFFSPDFIKDAIKLEEFAARANHEANKIMNSLDVVVLAKRSIQTILHREGKLLMFGNIIVGDSSGFCEVIAMNNSIQTLYAKVEVGDRLIIRDGRFKSRFMSDFKSCFNEDFQLDLEIKVREYDCRRIFKIVNPADSQWNVNLIPEYVTRGKELRLPSRLPDPLEILGPNPVMATHEEYFDILGIVSHVGRLERIWQYDWPLETRDKGLVTHKTYSALQWLELVDSAEPNNPLPVTLYVNADNWALQRNLTPGCLVILTNVMKPAQATDYGHRRICSTVFTKIYINEGTTKYLEKMSRISANAAMQMFSSPGGGMRRIYERDDVRFTVGGYYAQPFGCEETYLRLLDESFEQSQADGRTKAKVKNFARLPRLPFVQRQTQQIHFRGRILKFRAGTTEGTEMAWCTKNFPSVIFDYQRFNTIYPFHPHRNWYSFTYELPKLDLEKIPRALANLDSRERLTEFARMSYEKYCGPLLMPPKENTTTAKPDLPMLNGPPYYWVLIADDEHQHLYECLWKPSRYLSFEQMRVKLNGSKDASVMGVLEIFCMNPDAIDVLKYEVLLQDFTVAPKQAVTNMVTTEANTQTESESESEQSGDVNMEEIEREMDEIHSP